MINDSILFYRLKKNNAIFYPKQEETKESRGNICQTKICIETRMTISISNEAFEKKTESLRIKVNPRKTEKQTK